MLRIHDLRFCYKKREVVIHPLDIEIEPGFTFFVGENGSGKTTLIKLLAGILPSNETISFNGIKCGSLEYKKKLAYLPQAFELYPTLRISEILQFVAGLHGIEKWNIQAEITKVATQTNILKYMDQKYKNCSGGIQRRVGIACVLMGDPDLVLLDEPTVGIDPKERVQLYNTLNACFDGKTVIISTHILEDADVLADNMLMLSKGKLVYYGNYQAFGNYLKGKVYLTNVPRTDLIREFPEVKILSDHSSNGCLRVYSEVSLPKEQFKLVEATNEDIWMYYQDFAGDL